MVQPNKVYVRAYYEKNKSKVAVRKALVACATRGAVPTYERVLAHDIPIKELCVSYSKWVGVCDDAKRAKRQGMKLRALVDKCL